MLVGLEAQRYDGPWKVPQDHRRFNGVIRLADGTRQDGWCGTLMGYAASWTATDQIAQRAVDGGAIGRFDSLYPTSGGRSSRYSASGDWRRSLSDGSVKASAYVMRYECGVNPVPGLVQSTGYEVGVRTEALRGLQSSLSFWRLDIGSELVFVGDAGTTGPNRPSRRYGVEFSNRYIPVAWLLVDLDLAWSRSRFDDEDPAGSAIPGAVSRVGSLAVTVRDIGPWSGTLALRHLGARPLLEDRSVVARAFTLASMRVGYRFNRNVESFLDVFNHLDRKADDIEYYYDSRSRTEGTAIADRHLHPVEPARYGSL